MLLIICSFDICSGSATNKITDITNVITNLREPLREETVTIDLN